MKPTFLALLAVLSVGLTACGSEPSAAAPSAPVASATAAAKPVVAPPAVVMEMAGDGIKTGTPFSAPRTWTLSYTYDCSNLPFKGNLGVFLYRGDQMAKVLVSTLGESGQSSTTVYETGQGLHLEVHSACSWTLKAMA